MAENEQSNDQAASGSEQSQDFGIQRIYVKDLSFEAPSGVEVFQAAWKPSLNVNLNTKAEKIKDDLYEAVLTISLESKLEDKTAFLVEIQQAGIFMCKGFTHQQLDYILNVQCPVTLFPYARESIDNLVLKGSFPAVMMAPINFDALYRRALEEKAKEKSKTNGEGQSDKTEA